MNPIIYNLYGTRTEVLPKNGRHFTFKELYPLLDCTTIQQVPLHDGTYFLCDEDAGMKQTPVNNQASTIAREALDKSGRVTLNAFRGKVLHCSEEWLG
jgi:hypothetical protein